ncbi:MAG: SUMF1/EgtB/PvdO family nonheme iron enzyme [Bacteroidales bacterium]|nr:SUMF1/EgtB/PvdO family nonheme iron enzyme [Bacteroidales bacterium]
MKKLIYLTFVLAIFASCSTDVIINEETKVIDTGVNPDSWAVIPAGPFYYNMHAYAESIDYDYEMMITDVTNQQYADYLNEASAKGTITIKDGSIFSYHPGDPFDGYLHEWEIPAGDYLNMPFSEAGSHIKLVNGTFTVDKGFANHPVVMVTWFGAQAYANFYGYRLPTEKEWAKAARGTDLRAYPWGDEINKHYTNYGSSNNALKRLNGGNISRTTPVGYFNGTTYGDFETIDNRSPYGLYDMGGNVWQWLGDDYKNVHYRYMRGGSFTNYEYNLFVWARNSAGPDFYNINIGFRCARDVVKEEVPVEDAEEVETTDEVTE